MEADLSTQARVKAACELTAQPKLGNGGDLDAFCAELRGKGVSFKIASTHATNPAQKASGQAEEVLPSARHTPPQKRRHPLS